MKLLHNSHNEKRILQNLLFLKIVLPLGKQYYEMYKPFNCILLLLFSVIYLATCGWDVTKLHSKKYSMIKIISSNFRIRTNWDQGNCMVAFALSSLSKLGCCVSLIPEITFHYP